MDNRGPIIDRASQTNIENMGAGLRQRSNINRVEKVDASEEATKSFRSSLDEVSNVSQTQVQSREQADEKGSKRSLLLNMGNAKVVSKRVPEDLFGKLITVEAIFQKTKPELDRTLTIRMLEENNRVFKLQMNGEILYAKLSSLLPLSYGMGFVTEAEGKYFITMAVNMVAMAAPYLSLIRTLNAEQIKKLIKKSTKTKENLNIKSMIKRSGIFFEHHLARHMVDRGIKTEALKNNDKATIDIIVKLQLLNMMVDNMMYIPMDIETEQIKDGVILFTKSNNSKILMILATIKNLGTTLIEITDKDNDVSIVIKTEHNIGEKLSNVSIFEKPVQWKHITRDDILFI